MANCRAKILKLCQPSDEVSAQPGAGQLPQFMIKMKFRLVEDTTNVNSTYRVNSANHCKTTSYENDFRYDFAGELLFPPSNAGMSPFPGSQTKNSISEFAAVGTEKNAVQ